MSFLMAFPMRAMEAALQLFCDHIATIKNSPKALFLIRRSHLLTWTA